MSDTGQESARIPILSRRDVASGLDATGSHGVVDPRVADYADEVIGVLKADFEDPATAWAALQVEVGRRIEHPEEWESSEGAGRAEPGCPEPGTGDAMPTPTSPLSRRSRPFRGFDRERATYERHKAELLETAVGKFVVIVADELVGPLATDREAERAGYTKFGLGPLYIKQVIADEPTSSPVHLPLPAYADIAALALRAEALTPAGTPPGQRVFVGYDRERAAYARLKPELLARAEGKYVVLVGEDLEGPVDTFEGALHAGWRRFGLGPLYVKQVLAEEAAAEAVGDPSCQS